MSIVNNQQKRKKRKHKYFENSWNHRFSFLLPAYGLIWIHQHNPVNIYNLDLVIHFTEVELK